MGNYYLFIYFCNRRYVIIRRPSGGGAPGGADAKETIYNMWYYYTGAGGGIEWRPGGKTETGTKTDCCPPSVFRKPVRRPWLTVVVGYSTFFYGYGIPRRRRQCARDTTIEKKTRNAGSNNMFFVIYFKKLYELRHTVFGKKNSTVYLTNEINDSTCADKFSRRISKLL